MVFLNQELFISESILPGAIKPWVAIFLKKEMVKNIISMKFKNQGKRN